MTNESGLREKIARAIGSLEREPLAAITSLDGTVKEPLICLTVSERDAILALISPAGEVGAVLRELIPAVEAYLMSGDVMSQSIKRNTWGPVLKRARALSAPRGMEG